MNENKKLDAIFWGAVLVWAGLVFGGEAMGMLPQFGSADPWSWIFLGAGVLSLALNFFSQSSDAYEDPSTSDWVWGGIFLIIGVGGFIKIDISWPLIIILVGAVMLVNAFISRD